jgi:4-hydroxy-tetrahydrodipicolinate synthase
MPVPAADRPQDRPFHGIWSAILTPLGRTFAPDHKAFAAHARFLLDNGCHGIAPFGTTGEANSFSVAERMAGLEALVDAGISPATLIPGTGCCAGPDTVALTRHAASLGCKGVLMLPPFYYKNPSEEGLYRAFSTVIDRVADSRLRVLLYHIPPMSQIPIPHGLIRRLDDAFPGVIAGLKDSSGDWSSIENFIRAFPELAIFPGSEQLMLDALRIGGVGCISATCNINPHGIRAVFDAYVSGSADTDALQAKATAARQAIQAFPVIPAMKRLIAERRKMPEWEQPRAPFLPLDDAAWTTLDGVAAECGYLV